MQIKDLKPNAKNPRRISARKLEMLKKSLEKYGDLSGFVYNRRTKTLVSGHQRQKSVPPNAKITIEVKHEQPTEAHTVAEGFVQIGAERFKYREVDAPAEWETEALLAANAHGGTWDADLLRLNLADHPSLDLELVGLDMPKLQELNIEINMPTISVGLPAATSRENLDPLSSESDQPDDWAQNSENDGESPVDGTDEDADAHYLAENPGPDSMLAKENLPSMVNDSAAAFDAVEESLESKNTRLMVVIEVETKDGMARLKEKLRTDEFNLAQYGAKMY